MSRALDESVVAALQSGDHQAAYEAVAALLAETATERLEWEFLGHDYPPLPEGTYYLRDGPAVAIPKLVLVQAFFVARRMLQATQGRDGRDRVDTDVDADKAALDASAVALLMDPEHLTAANRRKRILERRLPCAAAAAAELGLVDSLLTSHLHRHTKSPTLWNHRRWLLATAAVSTDVHAPQTLLQNITDIVMVAGVRHPRNYYAWDHARWLVVQGGGAGAASTALAPALVQVTQDWCCRNHQDTSGWSFLLFLLVRWLPAQADAGTGITTATALLRDTLAQVQRLAVSLRWTGEAVWVFLRTAAAAAAAETAPTDDKRRLVEAARVLQGRVEVASHDWMVLQRAQDWCANA